MNCQTLLIDDAPAVRLQGAAGDTVTVLLRGAQVISWVDASGVERLYCSPASPLKGPQAVRGGVPVIFPQFAARGSLMRHGWARMRGWTLQPWDTSAPEPSVSLQLHNAVGDDPQWPHACVCTLTVSLLPNGLRMALTVENTGPASFSFHAALHTYLAVGDVAQTTLAGVLPEGAVLSLREPIDQIFEAVTGPLQLHSPLGLLRLEHAGFGDVVVWNPGPDAGLADLPPLGHTAFACVEAAAVMQPVALAPGAHWQGSQTLLSGL
ncbi:D-hexose-6-phosphate mutarotase [Rhodoferax saidenbachensis]|uniref:Putative glucose-6-phosphate 1-epimerase n=1 Tax=Rhodoferax saidenbachensis TaxID=1484693 RepID=A0ABU1ZQV0_9BURK|nr:D-hexose-6-phosphate mutarotase [Rhodoferax saidenbachensis]MDR7307240.1 glucose-6-phosphate 1-epimerase [Rhodoferax saidenbachensis]